MSFLFLILQAKILKNIESKMKKLSFLAIFLLSTLFVWAQSADLQCVKQERGVKVEMETTMGKITLLLYDKTPHHRDNFVKLVNERVYDGLLFHRVIRNFMVQAGDPKSRDAKPGQMLGDGSLGYTIPAEINKHYFHKRGALCAARQGDNVNPKRESSASQFYIVQGNRWDNQQLDMMEKRMGKSFSPEQRKAYTTVGGTPHLDGEYTVFGEVIKGMEVIDKIAEMPTDRADRPMQDVRILRVSIVK